MRHFCLILLLMLSLSVTAQSVSIETLRLQARADYQRELLHGNSVKDNCGFKGKYLQSVFTLNLPKGLAFSWRQRWNKFSKSSTFFDATDWLYLSYSPTPQWTLSAGKEIVQVGGFEYDRPPIDIFYASEYWNSATVYEWGATVQYHFRGGKDKLLFQFCQSPFRQSGQDTYAYNLLWAGHHGAWSTLWSVNAMEHSQGRFIYYLALGNAFDVGKVRFELDFMNRAAKGQPVFLRDCSVMAEVRFQPLPLLAVSAKATYDVNRTTTAADHGVQAGTETKSLGASVEVFPLKDNSLRVHAAGQYSFGPNSNAEGTLLPKRTYMDVGLTYYLDFVKLFHLNKQKQ